MADREGLPEGFDELDDFRKWLELFRVNARKGFASLTTSFPNEDAGPRDFASAQFWNRSDMAAKLVLRAEIQDGQPVLVARLFTGSTQEEMNEKAGQWQGSWISHRQ